MNKIVANALELYSVIAILIAYALLNWNIMSPISAEYYFLNFTGAAGIMTIAATKKAYQPFILNIFWAIVAIVGIAQTLI